MKLKKLSKGIPHVRVDLYEINGKVYFGELTFSPAGGFERFDDEKWNQTLGNFIDLKMVKNLVPNDDILQKTVCIKERTETRREDK